VLFTTMQGLLSRIAKLPNRRKESSHSFICCGGAQNLLEYMM
jgi:hypothetical protein